MKDLDTDGLEFLRWSMFDSPDSEGSAYRFMEREPVYILDRIVARHQMHLNIELAYVSKAYADKNNMSSQDSHRIGKAVRIRVVGSKKRMKLVAALVEQGVRRIAINKEYVYFDTDDLKPYGLFLWS